jgi:hypothetical protein
MTFPLYLSLSCVISLILLTSVSLIFEFQLLPSAESQLKSTCDVVKSRFYVEEDCRADCWRCSLEIKLEYEQEYYKSFEIHSIYKSSASEKCQSEKVSCYFVPDNPRTTLQVDPLQNSANIIMEIVIVTVCSILSILTTILLCSHYFCKPTTGTIDEEQGKAGGI